MNMPPLLQPSAYRAIAPEKAVKFVATGTIKHAANELIK